MLANALAGTTFGIVGIDSQCLDGLDNDADTFTDIQDNECFNYPYEDGNGETLTEPGDQFNARNYVSLFEYHRDNSGTDPQIILENVCFAATLGLYDDVGNDLDAAGIYIQENGGCPGGSGP